jgi:hypothetical protein
MRTHAVSSKVAYGSLHVLLLPLRMTSVRTGEPFSSLLTISLFDDKVHSFVSPAGYLYLIPSVMTASLFVTHGAGATKELQ